MSRNMALLGSDRPSSRPTISVVPAQYAQSTPSVAQIIAIVRAHWKQALTIALVMLALTVVVVKILPKSYTAEATVQVNFEGGDGTRNAPQEVFASYLVTQASLLQSRDVVMSAIDRLGLTNDPEFTAGFKSNGINNIQDFVAKQVSSSLSVEQSKGSQLINVSFTSKDRTKAAAIVNAVVQAYQSRESTHSDDPTTGRAHEYNEQLADLKTKLTAAEGRMAEWRQRTGITDIGSANDVETQALAALEQQELVAQSALHTAQSKGVGDQNSSDSVISSALVQNLKNQISTLQAELAQSSSTLGPKHPKVLELQSQIAAARRSLATEVQTYSQNNSGQVVTSQQLYDKTRRAVQDQRDRLVKVRAMQDEGQKLQLELESAQTVYKHALDGYDQVMFASTSVVSKAIPPLEASKPNKLLLLAAGIFFSGLLAMGVPLVYELFFDRRLHCRADIERELGLPVLTELGRLGLVSEAGMT
jgi:polysaccharide biosynthesis transport protein